MSDTEQTTPTESNASTPDTSQGQQINNEGQSEATFTQADVDRIVSERAKRASETAISKLLESLGVDDVEQAKKTFTEAKKRKEADMSDLEKAQAQIEEAKLEAKSAKEAKEALEAQLLDNARKQAFVSAVRDSGGKDVEDLYILVTASMHDEFLSVFGDSGEVSKPKMDAFIKTVQAKKPMFFGTASAGLPSANNGVAPTAHDYQQEQQNNIRNQIRRTF